MLILEVIEPLVTRQVEPMVEATPTLDAEAYGVGGRYREKGFYPHAKKYALLTHEIRGIVTSSTTTLVAPAPEEGGSISKTRTIFLIHWHSYRRAV